MTTPETSTSVTRAVALEVGWATGRSSRRSRRLLAAAVLVGLAWSLWAAGLGRRPLVNGSGWPQALELVSAIGSPELAPAFLRVVAEAALVTVGYAVLGTALALLLGVTGGFVVSQTFWRSRTRGRARVGWA